MATRSLLEAIDGMLDLQLNVNRILKKLETGTVRVEIVETNIPKIPAVTGVDNR
ncbi:MAG: hypothetical protein NTV68_12275 [Methanomicrobiales archaeon]|nr:hypothetical protein [Methanomicrobiales archaeon]